MNSIKLQQQNGQNPFCFHTATLQYKFKNDLHFKCCIRGVKPTSVHQHHFIYSQQSNN